METTETKQTTEQIFRDAFKEGGVSENLTNEAWEALGPMGKIVHAHLGDAKFFEVTRDGARKVVANLQRTSNE